MLYDSGEAAPSTIKWVSHLGLLLILVALFMRWNHEALRAVHGADPAGYLKLAERIADHGFLKTAETDKDIPKIIAAVKAAEPGASAEKLGFFLTPLAHVSDAKGHVRIQYPPGYPLILSVFYRIDGERGVYYAQVGFLLIGVLLNYLLVWTLIHPLMALPTTAILAGCNWYFAESTLLMADHAGVVLALLALFFGVLTVRSKGGVSFVWAALTGAALGFGIMCRYQNALVAFPLLILALFHMFDNGLRWTLKRVGVALLLTVVIGGVPLALYQHAVTGNYFSPTYTKADLDAANFLSPRNAADREVIVDNIAFYRHIYERRIGLWTVPIVLGLIGMAIVPKTRTAFLILFAMAIAVLAYHFCIRQRYERYLLLLVPLLCWPAGMTVGLFFDGLGFWSRLPRVTYILVFLLSIGYVAARFDDLDCGIGAPRPRSDFAALADIVPPDGVILCEEDSATIPLYAGHRRTARLSWEGDPASKTVRFTAAAIRYWAEQGQPVFVLADNPEVRLHFDTLRRVTGLHFEPVDGPWDGWQLWQYVPGTATAPAAEPAAPVIEPAAPAIEPAMPAIKPAMPVTKTPAPKIEPEAPTTEPAALADEPPTPATQPAAPTTTTAPATGKPARRPPPATRRRQPQTPRGRSPIGRPTRQKAPADTPRQ